MIWGHLENLTGVRREGGDVKGVMDIEIVGLLTSRCGRKIAGGGQEITSVVFLRVLDRIIFTPILLFHIPGYIFFGLDVCVF